MNCHLIPIKVSIKCRTYQGMELNCAPFNQLDFKGLNTQTVKRRCPVQQNRSTLNGFFEGFPNFRPIAFNQPFGAFHISSKSPFFKDGNHKRTEKLESHLLRQTALGHFQLRTRNNYRTSRVIHTFSEQVPSETAFFAFQHITEGF